MLDCRCLLSSGSAAAAAATLVLSALGVGAFGVGWGQDERANSCCLGPRFRAGTRSPVCLPAFSPRRSSAAACESVFRRPSPGGTAPPSRRRGLDSRTRRTSADVHYSKYGTIPRPTVVHAALPDLAAGCASGSDPRTDGGEKKKGVLVVGDVHGCLSELLSLVSHAVDTANDGQPFRAVVLVGDLCNKGPSSAAVVRHVRTTDGWFAVRGNHDDGALAAALGDEKKRSKRKYRWVIDGERNDSERMAPDEVSDVFLTDDDILWLSELPYTIAIPRSCFEDVEVKDDCESPSSEDDVLVVHAGLVPGVQLEDQTIETMITIREVDRLQNGDGSDMFRRCETSRGASDTAVVIGDPHPWASVYRGPPLVVFGHDARRGFQRYEMDGDWAIGLDTGACYGKRLTGLVLPGRKIVTVESIAVHSPLGGSGE